LRLDLLRRLLVITPQMIDALLVKVDKRDASKDYIVLALDALAVPPHSID
jgi:hypothetical protein